MTTRPSIVVAVEDDLSGAVVEKLLSYAGSNFNPRVHNVHGYGNLKKGMTKFREASRLIPHIVLTDLDRSPCPPALIDDWKAKQLPSNLLFRVAVREVEAWLLADRIGISEFLRIDVNKVPYCPEMEDDPKRYLINLARKCRSRRFSEEIIPGPGSSAPIGPLYNYHFINFVNTRWDIREACQNAPSLKRTLLRITSFLSG